MSLDSKNGFDEYIKKRLDELKTIMETSLYGEIKVINDDGTVDVYLPSRDSILPDVTLFMLGGGGEYISFPIAIGDPCWLSTSKDDMLDWLGDKDIDTSASFDLNSSVAFVGIQKLANAVPVPTITTLNVTKVKIVNETAEVITTLSDIMAELVTTLQQIQALTVTCAGPGNPSTVPINSAAFATIETQLSTLKTQIDSFKE